ncbi:GNAT family N-acetyltransferase [Bdellovibrio reynosensis]|uniref:GNAT family N-acetyltransferase n=1 Tax=Bdellovibrio reynosensis TaxID=2835041 RepID=A0ABY4CC04_9BACT|nr:GNAT family N-acetyltransferase [Bdellovibrio reynosensis]UOF01048.1 GNAT family N-acetyltransferase [Bdellovibrio reynosensis]
MKANYTFTSNENTINLNDFQPRKDEVLTSFINQHSNKKIFYLQKFKEGFMHGSLFSYILYSPAINFFLDESASLSENVTLENGQPKDIEKIKNLLIKHNTDNIIFQPEALVNFEKYTAEITKNGFSFQVYIQDNLIAHASVAKIKDTIFWNQEIYVLLRFIVDEKHRKEGIQNFLMNKIKEQIPPNSPLCLQVFPNNSSALKYFLRNMNVQIAFEKWMVN